MLIKDVAAALGERVTVVTEEYGDSEMARRFGVRRYPVVFVDDVLMARPKDFGFAGPDDQGAGRYVPWRDPANQRRFKEDLRRMVERRLKGETVQGFSAEEARAAEGEEDGPPSLPSIPIKSLAGQSLTLGSLKGRLVLVEIWATWCPPCRSTLAWLDRVQREHGDRIAVVAIAVDSPEADVRKMMAEIKPAYQVVLGTPEVLAPFGTVAAVPKMFLFDPSGARADVFYGAPPDLHDKVEARVRALIKP